MTWTEVADAAQLREILGEPAKPALAKERDALHELDRAWLAASPFCLIATSAADGSCDVSPKGDPPGFTLVLNERTIVVPERAGNRRADSFHNVLSNPHVGLIYFLPGRGDTLRVNGRARLLCDAPFFDDLIVRGHRPALALLVQIEQVFHHCSKAFLRSRLWDPESWRPDAVARRALIAHELERPDQTLDEVEAHYGPAYESGLYPSA